MLSDLKNGEKSSYLAPSENMLENRVRFGTGARATLSPFFKML